MEKTESISRSPSETQAAGERLGNGAGPGDCFLLFGDLGAGKTQFVKGMAKGLGVEEWEYVVSPSFTVMNHYEGRLPLCHVDLYRVEGQEVEDLQVEEFLEKGVVVVEWAERGTWWPGVVKVQIEVLDEDERKITVVRE